ncbi:PREDICTED: disease resistance protein RPP13-like [Ipomoea nil]|uniref:disease resistance protein RPP13-like n=1 Tax=Ipomoea nil TaxID=35883 RepID=UPI000900CC6D|nr:PREDICTED: disease resistance protein RPP13-like [Ipomoea nil]
MVACVAVLSLMRTLELEFFQPRPRPILQELELLIPFNKDLIQSLHQSLRFLMEPFDENRIDGTAQRESSCHSSKLRRILQQAVEEIDGIKEGWVKIKNEDKLLRGRKAADSSQPPASSDSDNKMVGKDKEFEIIKEMLIRHSSANREVVLIKGMGGIGKTTLARQLYRDREIASHFDTQTWCVASQHHNKKQMLLALLNSTGYSESSYEDLESKLYQRLKKQRYLVVIDDVWSNWAWNDVQSCFPDDGCGSRVLITTHLEEVASSTCSNKESFYHKMSFLNQSESWELFRKKAYKVGDDKFEMIGKQIVEKCDGLPLAIVMVAGLLSKLNTVDHWKDIAESLNSFATIIDDECSTILSFSYNHLSPNLKA